MIIPLRRRGLKGIGKFFSVVSIVALMLNLCFIDSAMWQKTLEAEAGPGDPCKAPVDVMLVMDVSGSMNEGGSVSKCQWERYELIDIPTNTYGYNSHLELGLSQDDCNTRCLVSDPLCRDLIYTPSEPNKIESAKSAANSFLGNMLAEDQSALVSFSDTASLIKQLSNDHDATKSAVNGLVIGGSTNIGGAIDFASGELNSVRANPQAFKAIILLTDGKANRPSGDGYNENPTDVAYAEAKATEAKALGYKIFTIGLGTNGDINETMLTNIASQPQYYYHAGSGADLSGIYTLISNYVCQQTNEGVISGCKYSDLNSNGVIEPGEPKLPGWEIVLGGTADRTQLTDASGCYSFAGLASGAYTVSEGLNADQPEFSQTWPIGNSYAVTLNQGENLINQDFANYLPIPAIDDNNNVISGHKYADYDGLTSTTDDRIVLPGWNIYLTYFGVTPIANTTTDATGHYEFNGLAPGVYWLIEEPKLGWTQLSAPATVNLVGTSTISANNDFVNATTSSGGPICGNYVIETSEACDDGNIAGGDGCSAVCQIETSGGGGNNEEEPGVGGGPVGSVLIPGLTIFNEQSSDIGDTSAVISWQTNLYATSRVIYNLKNGDAPCAFDPLAGPNFSFANSTAQNDTLVTYREVALAGLQADTTYCYRVISHVNLPETISQELTFRTAGQGIAPPVTISAPITPEEQPYAYGIGGGEPEFRGKGSVEDTSTPIATIEEIKPAGQISATSEQDGQVAGAVENCQKWPNYFWIFLVLAYLLMLSVNYADKAKKDIREKYGSALNWLFAVLPIIVAIVAMIVCGLWAWWLWILMIIFYLALMLFYLVHIDSPVYWRVNALVTAYMLIIYLIIRNCFC